MMLFSGDLFRKALISMAGLFVAALLVISSGEVRSNTAPPTGPEPQELPVVFSGDGTRLASVDADGRIGVLDLVSGQELVRLGDASGASVQALAFSPDGQRLASASDHTITLWELASAAELFVLHGEIGRSVTRLAFSPHGDALAIVVDGVEVAVWHSKNKPKRTVLAGHDEPVSEIAFSADGRFLVGSGSGAELIAWDLKGQREPITVSSPTGAPITGIAVSPVGRMLAAADEDANITLWDADTSSRTVLAGHVDLVKRFRFSPDGTTLASEGRDAQLLLWELESGQEQAAFPARFDPQITGLAFSPDGALLAAVGEFNDIYLWDVSSGDLEEVLTGHAGQVRELTFGATRDTLASVGADGQVIVWDLAVGSERFVLQLPGSADTRAINALTAGPLGSSPVATSTARNTAPDVATTTKEASPAVVETAAGEKKATSARALSAAITSLAVSSDGSLVASAGKDGTVRVFSDTGEELKAFRGDSRSAVASVVFSPDGKELFVCSRDSTVHRLKRADGKIRHNMRALEHPCRAVANNGNLVAVGGDETRVHVFNGTTGKLLRSLPDKLDVPGHKDFVNALAFRPKVSQATDEVLASGGKDGRILLWAKNGSLKHALLGHAGAVNAVVYSGDGRFLASASADSTVKIWNTRTGRQLQSLNHSDKVQSIAVWPGNRYLASAAGPRIYIWDVKAGGKLIKILSAVGTDRNNALAVLPTGRLLVGEDNGNITVWDVENSRRLKTITPKPLPEVGQRHDLDAPLVADAHQGWHRSDGESNAGYAATQRSLGNWLLALAGHVLEWLVPTAHAQTLPDPNQGPGGPILVIDSASSLFGTYYAEILRAEGFNAFSVTDIGSITPPMLAAYEVVILAEMSLTSAQVTMLTDWVNAGGNLIAMRPDGQLAGLLGLSTTGQILTEGYLLVDTWAPPGNGIVGETIQFHGSASRFNLNGAVSVATLYSDATIATSHPAVTLHDVGTNGGQTAAFAYDLATSIVYTRQGNPAWANQERDGFAPQRSDDKYYGNAIGNPQPDWVDLNKVAIPQADEQQRLLANLIVHMTRDQKPLPRFWYFPRGEKAVVIMTGDDHANNGTAGRWDQFLAASPPGCSVEDWECVRGTSYMYTNTPLTDAQAAAYEAQGFEVGLHVNTGCADYTEAQLETFYAQQIAEFSSTWPSAPPPMTQRHHCIAWTDWVTGAKVQLNHGVRLDTSYYFWPPSWVLNRPGFFNGSGMPMRFADLDGTLIDVYQVASQMTDESGQQYPYTIDTLLDRALGAEGYYGAYTINAHTDLAQIPESDAVVASAQARNVPIVTSRQMLEWLDGRNGSSFDSISWDGTTLSFTVTTSPGANGLQALVPFSSSPGVVTGVTHNGTSMAFTSVSRKGAQYASFAASDGVYTVSYGADTIAPTVISVSPADGASDVSKGTAVSAVFSEPMAAATINNTTFELLDAQSNPVAADLAYDAGTRSVLLVPASPLDADTTYTAILGAGGVTDLSGNPLATAFTWSFTTEPPLNCPCSIWSESDAPANPSTTDPNAVELGVKFRSDIDGFVTGVRFYKGSGNTGVHVGNLWTAEGTLLATAIFSNETATGWQQVDFAAAVPISANTVYVASYHAPNGGYASDASAFAGAGVDSAPLHALSDPVGGGNGVYGYGPGGFPNQTWNATNYWVDVVFSDTPPDPSGDTTPPNVTTFTPADGATDVTLNTSVAATFNEAMDPATIDNTVFRLLDGSSVEVPATVAYDPPLFRATLTPTAALEASSPYTAILSGGGPADLAGNELTADVSWSFTTQAAPTCPCTTWGESDGPANPSENDPAAVELGVKFRPNADGFVSGVRFYKGTGNTGTHVGNLWTIDGTLLASAIFVNETATGWQQVDFSSPVAVTANTVYVASYHAPNGNYAADAGYFADGGVDSGYLSLLQDGVNGGNGVYAYGAGGFPTFSFQASNYWVDVVFVTETGPDTTPPSVISMTPADGATGVITTTTITVTFNEPMDPATISTATFELREESGTLVPGTVAYDNGSNTATLTPDGELAAEQNFTATVKGGASGSSAADLAGNILETDVSWNFTTASSGLGLWDNTVVPAVLTDPDTAAVELGVKFRSAVNGLVKGIRFYKGPQNTGVHTGSLWSSGGQLLAQAVFSDETTSGWQQVDFAAPVVIQANVVYVASYHTEVGRYSIDEGYFASAYTNGPLTAVADGENGGNGVYLYGPGGFPTDTIGSNNYWVDVVFETYTGPDIFPPTVSSSTPTDGAAGVSVAASVTATFNESMDPASITTANFLLQSGSGTPVPGSVAYDAATFTASLTPDSPLSLDTQYTAVLPSGGVNDVAGNALAADATWTFTTTDNDACVTPANAIVAENCLAGNPASEWDISGAGDLSIQGFATDISVDLGDTVEFKIDSDASDYRLDIYRMGYYGGDGARKVATVQPTATLPQSQPACLDDPATGLIDCGNWAISASWTVPTDATSGIYFARAVREDTGGASHIVFIVRDDAGNSKILFQTSDTTWQAYNSYGGNFIEFPDYGYPTTRAFKGSYNRPFFTRNSDGGLGSYNWVFHAEYPMVRWLEANGYDVSYFTGVDSDRFGALIQNHNVFFSVGHDEYWSGQQRANVEAARDAGVHLAFFSGNEVYRKIRWETSIDGSGTPHRTMVCYKESNAEEKIDPIEDVWTGSWRDARFSPPADGGHPENALTGTLFGVVEGPDPVGIPLQVSAEFGDLRFWRHTAVAALESGETATLSDRVVGYEFDEDIDNGFRPAGLMRLSSTSTFANAKVVGDNIYRGQDVYPSGPATHVMTLYRAPSGALVFGAGTVQWSWGLDGQHDNGGSIPDASIRQAMVNLLADMDVQPTTLQSNLVAATASTDTTAPTSTITSPAAGTDLPVGIPMAVTGTATDSGGDVVGGVEVSVDGGATWHPADGRESWSYTWTPFSAGTVTIKSRAVDDSGNLETPGAGIDVTIGGGSSEPVAVFGFDEGSGTTANDASGNGHTGTVTGATWANGRYGQALSFNGTSDWVTIADADDLDLSVGMTVSAWVNPTVLSGWRTVLMKEQASGSPYSLYAHDNAPRPAAYVNTGGGDVAVIGVSELPLNTWTHLAATYDGATLRLYVNGNEVQSQNVSGPLVTSSSPLRIGGNAVWGEYFSGRIDEVRVYNRPLSVAEIQADRDTPVSPP